MNLDLAIQNTLKRGPLDNALHGVISNYGQTYELHAIPQTIKNAEDMFGTSVGFMAPNPMAKASIPWAAEVSFVDTAIPSHTPFSAQGAWESKQVHPFNSPLAQKVNTPNLLSYDFNTGRYIFNQYL